MKSKDLKARKEIIILTSFLSAFHEEVVSHNDYLLIKDKNPNNLDDLEFISDLILRPWFFEYTAERRSDVIFSISYFIDGGADYIDVAFSDIDFIFDYVIEDRGLFLYRLKNMLTDYIRNTD